MTKTNKKPETSNSAGTVSQQQEDPSQPTKLDYKIVKHLKNKLPDKEAMFLGIKRVSYFTGSKAVDVLIESPWKEEMFKTRKDAAQYLDSLLIKKFFHRARKIIKMDGEKKKFKLDMHPNQEFEDSVNPFVWLYEPTSLKAWILCCAVVLALIAFCLFPLWPSILRTWVYYLCCAGLALLSSIIALAMIRHVIFTFIWCLTLGKIHFWLLPNLTEDVGFVESFWPIYTLEFGSSQTGSDEGCGCDSNPTNATASSSSAHPHQE